MEVDVEDMKSSPRGSQSAAICQDHTIVILDVTRLLVTSTVYHCFSDAFHKQEACLIVASYCLELVIHHRRVSSDVSDAIRTHSLVRVCTCNGIEKRQDQSSEDFA